jgi:hypothetical protein
LALVLPPEMPMLKPLSACANAAPATNINGTVAQIKSDFLIIFISKVRGFANPDVEKFIRLFICELSISWLGEKVVAKNA